MTEDSDNHRKQVLVLGAGLVTRPLVEYLLKEPDFELTVATRTVGKAEKMIDGHPRGRALTLNVDDENALAKLIDGCDLVISVVPYHHHAKVASLAIARGKPVVTTSYVSPEMRALNGAARKAGVLVLNEIGLDPGIDHMSAMRIIHDVERRGGKVTGFVSNCGGLPAPEADTNPWGYKFSWSPHGVVMAGRNPARYLWDGEPRDVPGPQLFADVKHVEVEGLGNFEVYPNRDSMGYRELYGLSDTRTLFRGTFRNLGHCDTWKALVDCGWLDLELREVAGYSYGRFFCQLLGCERNEPTRDRVANYLSLAPEADLLERMEWLGLFGDEPIPGPARQSPLDVLADRLLLELPYEEGERDMILLQHRFKVEYREGGRGEIVSTLVDFGVPNGDSSMSRTVSLPAAIAARLILRGEIADAGVHIPVKPSIYGPVLDELEGLGIAFKETVTS